MAASIHLPMWEIAVCGDEDTLVHGLQELPVMLLCHYRHLILVDTSRHHLIKA